MGGLGGARYVVSDHGMYFTREYIKCVQLDSEEINTCVSQRFTHFLSKPFRVWLQAWGNPASVDVDTGMYRTSSVPSEDCTEAKHLRMTV